mgnify:CR=1 FL=1
MDEYIDKIIPIIIRQCKEYNILDRLHTVVDNISLKKFIIEDYNSLLTNHLYEANYHRTAHLTEYGLGRPTYLEIKSSNFLMFALIYIRLLSSMQLRTKKIGFEIIKEFINKVEKWES